MVHGIESFRLCRVFFRFGLFLIKPVATASVNVYESYCTSFFLNVLRSIEALKAVYNFLSLLLYDLIFYRNASKFTSCRKKLPIERHFKTCSKGLGSNLKHW